MPEPLSKVLEPSVSVTYLDQSQSSDADEFLRGSNKYLEPVINEDDEEADSIDQQVPMQGDDTKNKETGANPTDGPIIYKLQKVGSEGAGITWI